MFILLQNLRHFARAFVTAWRDPEFQSLGLLASSLLALGTVFYRLVEEWSWLDSFYFCVITLATVGYGDFSPQTAIGKLFTIAYIFLGIGLLVAVFTRLANILIAEREEARSAEPRPRSKGRPS
jgi:voltage-gated potassium channel Kch